MLSDYMFANIMRDFYLERQTDKRQLVGNGRTKRQKSRSPRAGRCGWLVEAGLCFVAVKLLRLRQLEIRGFFVRRLGRCARNGGSVLDNAWSQIQRGDFFLAGRGGYIWEINML